jgi:purine-nucleoside phosphorylase
MSDYFTLEQIDEAVTAIRSRTDYQPRIAMILGSGLAELASVVQEADIIPSSELPYWPKSTVEGHSGRLVIGKLEGQTVLVMQGRAHYYEGYSMAQVTFPVRVMIRLGIQEMIITNASGAINPDYEPGDLMMLTDHISLIAMTGLNPLRGPNIGELGERFPDMSQAYNRDLMQLAREQAKETGTEIREGVYTCLAGPSFESTAEMRFLRMIGTDAVGMSTVPETIVAHTGGIKVLGFSAVSAKANVDGNTITTHEEVLEAGKIIVPKLKSIIQGVLRNL